jgi:toxin ParE1/3/4
MKPVTFDSEAEAEFRAAAVYYEGRQVGLGDDFVAEVEQAVQRIAQTPQAFPLHGSAGYRKCILRRFPYTLFFLELRIGSGLRPWRINVVVRDTGRTASLDFGSHGFRE